jgi:transposase
MSDNPVNHLESNVPSESTPLRGYIHYETKGKNEYARHCKASYTINGKTYHDEDYLGKVLDKGLGLFKNRKRGIFTFSIEKGYGDPSPLDLPLVYDKPILASLHFGDVWMVDQILKQTGLSNILESLMPNGGDTLKSLVAFRTIESVAYNYAEDWYLNSYARVLYPNAKLESSLVSQFHALLGQEEVYTNFFKKYLPIATKNDNIIDKVSIPILIDSTGLPNNIKTHFSALNNHNGIKSNEIRLIYIVDKNTKLPIYFRYVPGNIIDNSTLITTINLLLAYNIDIEVVIMDAGYSAYHNLEELIKNNIPFVTRMPTNRTIYNNLIANYGQNLRSAKNGIIYGGRSLYGQIVKINLFEKDIYAYIMLDVQQQSIYENYLFHKYEGDENRIDKIDKKIPYAGRFIILSSKEYPLDEILPLYYTRQAIEQVFDVSKNFADILPLSGHSEETIRARILISFISTIVYSSISFGVKGCNFSANRAIYKMRNLQIRIYNDIRILQELDKSQKEVFSKLKLDCPFPEERGNILKSKPLLDKDSQNNHIKKRGRPKGSKNINKCDNKIHVSSLSESKELPKKTRGRPKGSRNKEKTNF